MLGAASKDVRANVATDMLNRGFEMVAGMPGERVITYTTATPVNNVPQTVTYSAPVQSTVPTTFGAAYNAATVQTAPIANTSNNAPGNAGVQFGAFSSRDAATAQVSNVRNTLGVTAVIESAPNGMFRVRVNNLSESAAQDIHTRAQNAGLDSYIFH